MSESGQSLQVLYRGTRREVRFSQKTDVIPMPNPVTHTSPLCNRAEEYDHAGSSECDPNVPKTSAVEKGQAKGGKTAAAPQARLVDSDEAPDRRPRSRPRHVQPGNRQQASWV